MPPRNGSNWLSSGTFFGSGPVWGLPGFLTQNQAFLVRAHPCCLLQKAVDREKETTGNLPN